MPEELHEPFIQSDDEPTMIDKDGMHVFRKFLRSRALNQASKYIAKDIRRVLHPALSCNYLLFVHLRHPFSTLGPASAYVGEQITKQPDRNADAAPEEVPISKEVLEQRIGEIFVTNRKLGMSGLPHVTDALSKAKDCRQYGICLCFGTPANQNKLVPLALEHYQIQKTIPPGAIEIFRKWNQKISTDFAFRDIDVVPEFFEAPQNSLCDIIPHIADCYSAVCAALKINPSALSHRAFIVGLFRAWRYTTIFDAGESFYVTVRFRPPHPFGISLAATVITTKDPSGRWTTPLVMSMSSWYENINFNKDCDYYYKTWPLLSDEIDLNNATRIRSVTIVDKVAINIASRLYEERKEEGDDEDLRKSLTCAIYDFLQLVTCFTEEQFEGKPLEYGLILTNPMLFRFWPGARPIPLCYERMPDDPEKKTSDAEGRTAGGAGGPAGSQWYTPRELAADIHLTAGLRTHCIIIPYNFSTKHRMTAWSNSPIPTFSADLSDLGEGVVGWSPWRLWSSTAAIYAYLSHLYPWSVAAMVGPRAEIRVFVQGDLVAFRHGKGWRIRVEPEMSKLFSDAPGHERIFPDILEPVLAIALQSSTFARQQQHGGLFLYCDRDDVFKELHVCRDLLERRVKRQCGKMLLDKRVIMRRTDSTSCSFEMDYHAARLVHQVSRLDGAICFSKDANSGELVVAKFAQHFVWQPPDAHASGGTKRAAAKAFVQYCHMREPKACSFAIVVSSDGDIRIITHQFLEYNKANPFVDAFEPVREEQKEEQG